MNAIISLCIKAILLPFQALIKLVQLIINHHAETKARWAADPHYFKIRGFVVALGFAIVAGVITFSALLIVPKIRGGGRNAIEIKAQKALNSIIGKPNTEALAGGLIITEEDEEEWEEHCAQPSEIEGWTIGDKLNAGLSELPIDSDHDGLTDKEEVEVYHTDPASTSTANDLYTDGYKIAHGMDPFTYHEYEGEIEYKANKCSNVTFLTPTIFNMEEAYAEETPGKENYCFRSNFHKRAFDAMEPYATFDIRHYKGDVAVDIKSALNDAGAKLKDITVYRSEFYGYNIVEPKFEADKNGVITVYDTENSVEGDFTLIFAKKGTVKKKYIEEIDPPEEDGVFGAVSSIKNAVNTVTEKTPNGIVYGCELVGFFTNEKPKIYYTETGDVELDEQTKEMLMYIAENGRGINYSDEPITEEDCEPVDEISLETTKKMLEMIPFSKRMDIYEDGQSESIVCSYYDYDDSIDQYLDEKEARLADPLERAKSKSYEFPFSNFSSVYATGGNCSGIARLASFACNTGSLEKTSADDTNISWSIDPSLDENEPLLNGNFSEYKNENFVVAHTETVRVKQDVMGVSIETDMNLLQNLTDPEENFVRMVGYYWSQVNDSINIRNYLKVYNPKAKLANCDTQKNVHDFRLIEMMIGKLNEGKILEIHLGAAKRNEDGSYDTNDEFIQYAHSMNVIGYKMCGDIVNTPDFKYGCPDSIEFELYDSNFPDRKSILTVSPRYMDYRESGTTGFVAFDFAYDDGASYLYTSDHNVNKRSFMIITDETGLIYNDLLGYVGHGSLTPD